MRSTDILMLNPELFEQFHCAVLKVQSAKQDIQFSLAQLNQFFGQEAENIENLFRKILHFFGTHQRPDYIEINCETKTEKVRLFMVVDCDLAQLTERIIRLAYLFNQKKFFLLEKQCSILHRYKVNQNGRFIFCDSVENMPSSYHSIQRCYRSLLGSESVNINYVVKDHFSTLSMMGKWACNIVGKELTQKLVNVVKINEETKL